MTTRFRKPSTRHRRHDPDGSFLYVLSFGSAVHRRRRRRPAPLPLPAPEPAPALSGPAPAAPVSTRELEDA